MSATLPVTIPLSRPVQDGSRKLSEVVISRRRTGADLRAEADAGGESSDAAGLVQVQRLCGLLPSTPGELPQRDIDAILLTVAMLTDEPPDIDAWPYRLRFPVLDLSEVKEPREALGKDARIVGRFAGDNAALRMIAWVELLCGLTRKQFDALDAVDAEALCLGVVPFYRGSPRSGNVPESSPASPSSVTGNRPS